MMIRLKRFWTFALGRPTRGPHPGRRWKVWDLDSELRYAPVVAELPDSPLPVCEVGSGPRGLAGWTDRQVIGVDPGADDRHGGATEPPNMRRLVGDGANIPLPDEASCATVAVDTMEHIPQEFRQAVVAEMVRVTQPGGKVILIGPTGPEAAQGDRRVRDRWIADGGPSPNLVWLDEHIALGLPTVEELASYMQNDRVASVHARGVFNLWFWWTMHRAACGDFPLRYRTDYLHHFLWAPFAAAARRTRRGPFYRQIVVAELR
jgi:SAM-dependent methyltransferase